jgi:hypothetical protein
MASAATAPTSSVTTTGGGATAPAGGQVSGQEDSTEPSGEGQEGTDASGTEIDGGGEGGTGEGTGTGDGTGAGTGAGTGTGSGSGSGDGAGDGGGSGAYTPQVFEDYKFKGTYQAPELLKLARQYEDYQPSSVLQGLFSGFIEESQTPISYSSENNYAQTVADQIRNLKSFQSLSKDQVQNRLGLFEDSLLQEAVMQNLYGAGGR